MKENLLNGTNYIDWYRKLKIVLKSEKKLYILTEPKPDEPDAEVSEEVSEEADAE